MRVTAQLIEPKNDKHIWQNEYDLPYKEIITIQADIALQIADHLKAFLTSSEKQNIQKIPTTNQKAYELLQQTLHLFNNREYTSLDQLVDLSLRVIELDPKYADAYVAAARYTLYKGTFGGGSDLRTIVWDAAPYLDKALELDQNNGGSHNLLALISEWIKWDFIMAEKEHLKAIELEPNNEYYANLYTELLLKMNRPEDVLSKTSPTSQIRIFAEILSGNDSGAQELINTYLETYEERAHIWVSECYIWLEKYDSARRQLETAIYVEDSRVLLPRFQVCLALAYNKTGDYASACSIISQLIGKTLESSAGSPEYFTGWYYSGIGEVDSAFYWFEKAYQNRSPEFPWLKVDPVFKNLKNDDRYWDLYERTGHKAYDEYMAGRKK